MRLVVIALVLSAVVAAGVGVEARAAGHPPVGTFSGCPRDTRPLPGPLSSFAPPLRRAVLQFVRTSLWKISHTPSELLLGARIRSLILVRNWLPRGWIKTECGLAVWRRSVAVDVYFPRLDKPHNPVGHCNACAHLTLLAALSRGGWSVWGRY